MESLKWLLIAFVAVIFLFLATYGTFMIKKELDCAKTLYSDACYRTYPQFLNRLAHFEW